MLERSPPTAANDEQRCTARGKRRTGRPDSPSDLSRHLVAARDRAGSIVGLSSKLRGEYRLSPGSAVFGGKSLSPFTERLVGYSAGNGSCSHHGRLMASMRLTHLTHQKPRRPGATSRTGAPWPRPKGSPP